MFVLTHGIVWYTKLQNKENECTNNLAFKIYYIYFDNLLIN